MTLPVRAAVFASGSGTNFQALLDREDRRDPGTDASEEPPTVGADRTSAPWRTCLLVSDRDGAGALERARRVGVSTRVIPVSGRPREEVEAETLEALERAAVDVIFLAGYLRLVPAGVVSAFRRRILNIHPALLPAFGGKGMWGRHVHEAVLASGARISGATVHFVDERYDEGTILAQWPVPVRPDDTPGTLADRVLAVEHRLYPLAAGHLCRAVASRREPGPLELPGEAYSLVGTLEESEIARRFRSAFPEPRVASSPDRVPRAEARAAPSSTSTHPDE